MKRFLTLALLLLLTSFAALAQDEINYKRLSFSQFFKMIEMEEDTVFKLSDAIISYNPNTDSLFTAKASGFLDQNIMRNAMITRKDTLVIDKELQLDNVHFKSFADLISGQNVITIITGFQKIIFKRKVIMTNSLSAFFNEITFEKEFSFTSDDRLKTILIQLKDEMQEAVQTPIGEGNYMNTVVTFNKVNFLKGIHLDYGPRKAWEVILGGAVEFVECKFWGEDNPEMQFVMRNRELRIEESIFNIKSYVIIRGQNTWSFDFNKNIVNSSIVLEASGDQDQQMNISNNTFHKYVILELDNYQNGNVEWNQWVNKVVHSEYSDYINMAAAESTNFSEILTLIFGDSTLHHYQTITRIENKTAYRSNLKLLTDFYNHYKLQHDTENANLVYAELKDLETQRLRHSYQQSPNFENFFTWKINQFLAVFSAYGTKPAKAIIFSMKVILVFALIYLFFPNYWDSHGKNRIQHRFRFFYKYLSREEGIEHVYLEENQEEIDRNTAFKYMLIEHKSQAPKLFFNLAMPLYRWSMAGTLTYAWLIKRFDFLKGTWERTDAKSRRIKGFLVSIIFLFALTYDIFIKILNALMLSINTFTTLGFGEIPIKGLPRYLAIIQGFIGWFMLTIFSVSLISQLLN